MSRDAGILDAATTFLEGPQLREEEREVYFQPSVRSTKRPYSSTAAGLLRRARPLDRMVPLIGTGDWNDGMSSVGEEGKARASGWAWFLVDVLKKFAEVCAGRGEQELASRYRDRAERLSVTVGTHRLGW